MSCILIHDNDRSLRLESHCQVFIYDISGFGIDTECALVFFDHGPRLFFRTEDERVGVTISIADVSSESFRIIIFRCAVRAVDRQGIFYAVFSHWIERLIRDYLVTDLLDGEILGGLDGQAVAVKLVVGLSFGISFFHHKVIDHILDHGVSKVGIRCRIFCDRRGLQDPVVNSVCRCLVILGLVNVVLLQHLVEDLFPPFGILIRVRHRIILCRVLRDRRDDSTF